MSESFWDNVIDSSVFCSTCWVGRTFSQYVESVYETASDSTIAGFFTKLGHKCSPNRVRKFRKRQGWMKTDQTSTDDFPPAEKKEHVSKEESANRLVTYAQGADIKTLDELLEAAKVDLTVWDVERWIVNKWPVGAKTADKSLSYEKGVVTGTIEEHGLTVAALWQVKAWLIRKDPICIFPTVRPIECEMVYREKPADHTYPVARRTLVCADPHFGFERKRGGVLSPLHSREALDLVLQLAVYAKVDRIDWLGDMLDLADWSTRFLREPQFMECTQPAIVEGHWWLKRMRQENPTAEMKVHEGNHEKRMRAAMAENLKAAVELKPADELELPAPLTPPRLLGLHRLDIEWVGGYPADCDWLNDNTGMSHGERANSGPGDTAKAAVQSSDYTQFFGHCHRQELASRTMHLRGEIRVIQAWAAACLCHIDGRVPAKGTNMQWQNGCLLVDYEPEGRDPPTVTPVLFNGPRAIYDRQEFIARDHDAEIAETLSRI